MANEFDEISGLLKGEPGFIPKKRRKKARKQAKLKQRRSGKNAAK